MARRVEYCETCKAEREVRSVEVLSYGKKLTLECGHALRMRIFIVNEEMQISDNFSWVEQKNPVEEIRKAGKANDYSKSLTLACSVFEHYGKQILVWYLKKKMMMGDDDVLTPEKVRKLKLHEVIDALACRELITDTDATKMHCIRHLRNSFIHEEYSLKLPSEIAQKVDASIDDIINYTTILKDKYMSRYHDNNNAKNEF